MGDSDSVFLLKEKMSEMKGNLEKKVAELQEKLDSQIAENHKLDSDSAQWKGMAQKELKARLNLETEKASLQRELNETRNHSDLLKDRIRDGKRPKTTIEPRLKDAEYVVPDYSRSDKPTSGYHPMVEEQSEDVYRKESGSSTAAANCYQCNIQ